MCWKLLCVVSRAGNGRFVKSRGTELEGAVKGCLPWSCCEISEERGNSGLWHVWQWVANALPGGCRQQVPWTGHQTALGSQKELACPC